MTENSAPKNPLQRLDLNRQITAVGSFVLAVLSLLSWFKSSMKLGDAVENVGSVAGVDTWNGWMALIFAGVTLVWMFMPALKAAVAPKLPPALNEWIPVMLPALALLLGPVIFWFRVETSDVEVMGAKVVRDTTLFFWIALLAGVAATVGAYFSKTGKTLPVGPPKSA